MTEALNHPDDITLTIDLLGKVLVRLNGKDKSLATAIKAAQTRLHKHRRELDDLREQLMDLTDQISPRPGQKAGDPTVISMVLCDFSGLCPSCGGDGKDRVQIGQPCEFCHGTGQIKPFPPGSAKAVRAECEEMFRGDE